MGSSAQIALFVAPVLIILSYFIAPTPMDLNFGAGQVLHGPADDADGHHGRRPRSTRPGTLGVQLLAVYAVFAVTLYLMPN